MKKLKKKLWKELSLYVRRKEADSSGYNYCYTCGKILHYKELQAGHAIAGRNNAVLFDEEIIRPQCRYCNCIRHGEQYIFAKKLDKENGEGFFERKFSGSRDAVKFTKAQLEELLSKYKELNKTFPD